MSIPNTDELERANWYLERISPDIDRERWVKVLMAIKNTFGDSGLLLAQGWSSGSSKFNARDFKDTWQSLVYGGPIGLGTLHHLCTDKRVVTPPQKRSTLGYAHEVWNGAMDEPSVILEHPYAKLKKLRTTFGARRARVNGKVVGLQADCLIVPMYLNGELSGIECINREGQKQTFGQKGNLACKPMGEWLVTHVCEGWATGYALSQMFTEDWEGVIVCFGKGKLKQYAQWEGDHGRAAYIHHEGKDGRDAWDFWNEGLTEQYREWVLR